MKSAKVKDLLEVWMNNYGGSYEYSNERPGERYDEYLIGKEELDYTYSKIINGIKYYFIDFNKKAKNPLKKIVSSENAKSLNKNEIKNLIDFGLN